MRLNTLNHGFRLQIRRWRQIEFSNWVLWVTISGTGCTGQHRKVSSLAYFMPLPLLTPARDLRVHVAREMRSQRRWQPLDRLWHLTGFVVVVVVTFSPANRHFRNSVKIYNITHGAFKNKISDLDFCVGLFCLFVYLFFCLFGFFFFFLIRHVLG